MLRAIAKCCPQLKEVRFFMPMSQVPLYDRGAFRKDFSSPNELQEHFKAWRLPWPKVKHSSLLKFIIMILILKKIEIAGNDYFGGYTAAICQSNFGSFCLVSETCDIYLLPKNQFDGLDFL